MQCKDQLHTVFEFSQTPKRIVSLVPSQTELLIDLGLKKQVVGITKFCTYPTSLKDEKTIVGGTKTIHLDKIRALQPDIIICNKEENTKEIVALCATIAPVWVSDIYTLEDAFDIITNIRKQYTLFTKFIAQKNTKKVAYLIWQKPFMVAGVNTFINDLLKVNKFENIVKAPASRYPEMDIKDIKQADLILLSSEPFPFSKTHVKALEKATQKQVLLVDGAYFSWYGSRLQNAFAYFKTLH
jgi:iron complex transport system substrate-binding protein